MSLEKLRLDCETPGGECGICPVALQAVKNATESYLDRNEAHLKDFALLKRGDRMGIAAIWFGNPVAKVENCNLIVADDKSLLGPRQEEAI